MTDISARIAEKFSEQDWHEIAKTSGLPLEEARSRVLEGLAASAGEDMPMAAAADEVTLGAVATADNCKSQDFSASLFKAIGIKGTVELCGAGADDWSYDLDYCMTVAEVPVRCYTTHFDKNRLSYSQEINVVAARARLGFELRMGGGQLCLHVAGEGEVWAPVVGWKKGKFNKKLVCLPF